MKLAAGAGVLHDRKEKQKGFGGVIDRALNKLLSNKSPLIDNDPLHREKSSPLDFPQAS
jgi:hypothetical protein